MQLKWPIGLLLILCLSAIAIVNDLPRSAWAHEWKAPAKAAKTSNPVEREPQSIQMGQKVFQQFCASCHGPTGRGDGPAASKLVPKPADLVARAKHHSDGDFFWKIATGRPPMPGFKDQLSSRMIWHTINFIRSQKDH